MPYLTSITFYLSSLIWPKNAKYIFDLDRLMIFCPHQSNIYFSRNLHFHVHESLFCPPFRLMFFLWGKGKSNEEIPLWWSDWNESFLLWLVMASSQEMWSSVTLDRVRPCRGQQPHPSIFISLLYTGLVHTTPIQDGVGFLPFIARVGLSWVWKVLSMLRLRFCKWYEN